MSKKVLPLLDRMSVEDLMMHRSMHKYGKESADLTASQPRKLLPKPTPDNPLVISVSELVSFLRCRVMHHWSYQCGLVPMQLSLPLSFGEVGHKILESWYLSSDSWKSRTVNDMERFAKKVLKNTSVKKLDLPMKDLMRAMTVGYADWVRDAGEEYSDRNIRLNKCQPERFFVLPLNNDKSVLVRGKLDNFFEPGAFKKTVATLETKFKKNIEYDNLERTLQLTVYLWVLRQWYPKARMFIAYYQILRKQMPTSRVKTALFYREPIERDVNEIDQWAIDTRRIVRDMVGAAVYPNPMDGCNWRCDFKIPCLLRGDKKQLIHVLTTEYTTREKREEANK